MNQVAIYPGTFDPITKGHINLISRASKLFSHLIIAVAENKDKSPFFAWEERIDLVKEAIKPLNQKNVSIAGFKGLLIHFAAAKNANIIVRGLRATADFEFEFQLAGMNRQLSPQIETVFLTPAEDCLFISSSLVREIAKLGGSIEQFVPFNVTQAFKARQ